MNRRGAAVFDLGGVVVTWDPPAIVAAVFADPAEQALVLGHLFAHSDWVELDRGTLETEEAARRGAGRTGIDEPRLRALLAAVPRALVPIAGSLELVDELRAAGRRVVALSNLHRASRAHLEEAYDLFGRFDGLVISCEVGSCKPEAAIYERLFGELDIEPGASVMIDDCQANLDAADAFGMQTIRFEGAASCREELRQLGWLH